MTHSWDSLHDVFFHNCCHGGQRKKGTRWKSTPGVFDALSAVCQNDHEHFPFQVTRLDGQWAFDTAAEAAYPGVLTKRVAHLVKLVLEIQGRTFVPRPLPRLHTLAAQHRQHKKRDQLIPEFFAIQKLPITHTLTPFQKLLPSYAKGDVPPEGIIPEEGGIQNEMETQMQSGHHMVGTWHTPEQFVSKAKGTIHPMDENALEKITLDALDTVVNLDPRLLAIDRKKNLLKAKIKQKQTQKDEAHLHASLPASVEKVVHDKKIILWESLLQECGYDMGVVDFMTKGVPLVGTHDHPSCYAVKIKPATLTESELRESAIFCRQALMARRPQTDEPGFAEHLEETASEEVSMGFLDGPFSSESEVSQALGHQQWRIMRRFVIEQGAKLRPIDDGLEAQLNAAFSSTIRLDLQDADYVIASALHLGRYPDMQWLGKILDLSKAYKQLPILPEHRDLAVVFFRDRDGKPTFLIPNSLMFGSTAAV